MIMSNFDLEGQLPSLVRSWPTYSTRSFKKSHLLSFNERRAFEVVEELRLVDSVEENVVNDDAVAGVLGSGIPGFE